MSFFHRLQSINPYKRLKQRIAGLKQEVFQLNSRIDEQYVFIEKQMSVIDVLRKQVLSLRKKLKSSCHEKINLVFVCDYPEAWTSCQSIYEACIADDSFHVTIVTIPVKKTIAQSGKKHETYCDVGTQAFFEDFDCQVIHGYDERSEEWLDLQTLSPDYLFFQRPYNSIRPPQYHSSIVAQYTTLCYVHYAMAVLGNGIWEVSHPEDFIKDISLFFSESAYNQILLKDYLTKIHSNAKCYLTGFPRFDQLTRYKNAESDCWNYARETKKYRIVWTPRWYTNENNCHFFDYGDKLLNYMDQDAETDFVFRPHPLTFSNFVQTGEMSEKQVKEMREKYKNGSNISLDRNAQYFDLFYSSDVLITDISSIIADYFLTGKPIIYCHKTDYFNDFSRKLSEGFYWVRNWAELEETLGMLRSGNDPLKDKRAELIKSEFYLPNGGAGYAIKEILRQEALSLPHDKENMKY